MGCIVDLSVAPAKSQGVAPVLKGTIMRGSPGVTRFYY